MFDGRHVYVTECLVLVVLSCICCFFFFNDPATTEIYTLSLHDALPISLISGHQPNFPPKIRSPARGR